MTKKEFDIQKWKAEMKAEYRGVEFDIATVNFREQLVGLLDDGEITWVRCENIDLVKKV